MLHVRRYPIIWAMAAVAAIALAQPAHATLRINEMMVNPPGSDQGAESVEILGGPSESLANTWFLSIMNDGVAIGVITNAINLAPMGAVGTNGLLLIRDTAAVQVPAPSGATNVVINDFVPDLDNNHMCYVLVQGFSGALGNDLDTNDDGVLETTPWTSLLDAVGIMNSQSSSEPDIATSLGGTLVDGGAVVLPIQSFTPDGIFRNANNPSEWVGVDYLGSKPGPYTIDNTNTTNSAFDAFGPTFGSVNPGLISEKALAFNEFMMDPPGTDNGQEFIELTGNAGETTNNVSILVVDNDGPSLGTILNVVDLSTVVTVGQNEILLVRDSATVLQPAPAAGTNVGVNDFSPDLPNGSTTYLLVVGFSGSVGNDLDTNDDGLLESTPWTTLLDAVFISDPDGEPSIAAVLGGTGSLPQSFTPAAALLAPIGSNWVTTGVIGGSSPGPYTLDSVQIQPVTYAGEDVTPGNENPIVTAGLPAMKVEFFEESKK